jgi:hypothetical protein
MTKAIRRHHKTPTPENDKQSISGVVYINDRKTTKQTSFMWQSIFLDPCSTVGRQIVYVTIRPEGNCRRSIHPDALSKLITHRRYPRMVPTKTTHGNMEKLPSVLRTWTKNRAKSPSLLEHKFVAEVQPAWCRRVSTPTGNTDSCWCPPVHIRSEPHTSHWALPKCASLDIKGYFHGRRSRNGKITALCN